MSNLFTELNRRNVFRVAVFYLVVSWLLLQVTDVVAPLLQLPDWVARLVFFLLALGLVPALVLAWIYELTPEGVKKETDIDRSQSIVDVTGRRLDVMTMVVVLAAAGFAFFRPGAGSHPQVGPDASPVAETPVVAEPGNTDSQTLAPPADVRKSIAVLPFDNFSEDSANAFFASGVHEDILTHLAKVADLRVISRSSVEQFAETRPPIREIAELLGVEHVVEGSVRRAGDRVRVTAQLIDARSDEHLWADNFDRDLTDVFAIQTEISRQIVDALEATLSPQEERLISESSTENLEAYESFLKARRVISESEYEEEKYRRALFVVDQALDADPEFSLAHVLRSEVLANLLWITGDLSEFPPQSVRDPIERALAISPDLPEAKAALAQYYYRVDFDYAKALELFQSALEQMPGNVDVLLQLGFTQRRIGLFDDAIETLQEAMSLDPGNLYAVAAYAQTLNQCRRWEESIETLEPMIAERPGESDLIALLAEAYLHGRGDVQRARTLISAAPRTNSVFYTDLMLSLLWYERDFDDLIGRAQDFDSWSTADLIRGRAYRLMGRHEEAEKHFQAAAAGADVAREKHSNRYEWDLLTLARAQAYLGQLDEALVTLDQPSQSDLDVDLAMRRALVRAEALTVNNRSAEAIALLRESLDQDNGISRWQLKLDPMWNPLREEAAFQALLEPLR